MSFSTKSTGCTALGLREAEHHTAVEYARDFSPHRSGKMRVGEKEEAAEEGGQGREEK